MKLLKKSLCKRRFPKKNCTRNKLTQCFQLKLWYFASFLPLSLLPTRGFGCPLRCTQASGTAVLNVNTKTGRNCSFKRVCLADKNLSTHAKNYLMCCWRWLIAKLLYALSVSVKTDSSLLIVFALGSESWFLLPIVIVAVWTAGLLQVH